MKKYDFIDLAKFVLSFLVIAIHTGTNRIIGTELCSTAVPIFFLASGFFLFKSHTNGGVSKIDFYIKKIIRLYVLYTIIYLPLTVYGFSLQDIGLVKSTFIFIRNFLLVGENYYSWPLWYLLSLIISTLIIRIFIKRKIRIYYIFLCSILLSILGICLEYTKTNGADFEWMNNISMIYHKIFVTTRNGFFIGLYYVSLGMLMAQNENRIINKPLFITSIILCLINCFVFCLWIFAPSIFYIIIYLSNTIKINISNNLWLRNMSTLIYFFHMYLLFFVEKYMMSSIGIQDKVLSNILFFAITSISTIIFGALILYLKKYKTLNFLNRLLS